MSDRAMTVPVVVHLTGWEITYLRMAADKARQARAREIKNATKGMNLSNPKKVLGILNEAIEKLDNVFIGEIHARKPKGHNRNQDLDTAELADEL